MKSFSDSLKRAKSSLRDAQNLYDYQTRITRERFFDATFFWKDRRSRGIKLNSLEPQKKLMTRGNLALKAQSSALQQAHVGASNVERQIPVHRRALTSCGDLNESSLSKAKECDQIVSSAHQNSRKILTGIQSTKTDMSAYGEP